MFSQWISEYRASGATIQEHTTKPALIDLIKEENHAFTGIGYRWRFAIAKVLIQSALVILSSLLVDLVYASLDPRIRLK